jgi:hypothetical protein
MVHSLPEPQQHAIDQATAEQTEAAGATGDIDALGIPWNAEIHATGKDGKGVKTAKGQWRRRRGVAGTASVLGGPGATVTKDPAAEQAATASASKELACRQGGMMAARLLVNISVGVGGPEFMPRILQGPGGIKYDEIEVLSSAFGDYFVAKDIQDLPPGWMLAGALAMYYLPRFQMPETQKRARSFAGWLRDKWHAFRFRRIKRRTGERDKNTPQQETAATVESPADDTRQ